MNKTTTCTAIFEAQDMNSVRSSDMFVDSDLVASGPSSIIRGKFIRYKRYTQRKMKSLDHNMEDIMKDFVIPALGFKGTYWDFGYYIFDFLTRFSTAKSIKDLVLTCWSFMSSITNLTPMQVKNIFVKQVSYLFNICILPVLGKFKKYFEKIRPRWSDDDVWDLETIVPEDLSDDDSDLEASMDNPEHSFFEKLNSFLSERGNFARSDFAKRISSFIGAIISLPFFRKRKWDLVKLGFKESFNKKFLKEHDSIHPLQAYDSILQDTMYFIEKVTLVAGSKGALHHIYVDDAEVYRYEKDYNWVTFFYDKLETIESYKNGCTLNEYLTKCSQVMDENKRLAYACRKDKEMNALYKKQAAQLDRCMWKAGAKLCVSSKREAPIGMVLYGPPGIGKSDLVDKIMTICYQNAIYLGHATKPYDKDYKYVYNQTDEFMSEYRVSKEVCVLDDVDQFTTTILEQMKGGAIAKTIEFVNVTPYVTNQAELAAKGMIPFMSKYVILTTNNPTAGLQHVFRPTSGAMRRYLFLDINVKERYRKNGQTQLGTHDRSQSVPTLISPDNHDLHEFTPRRFDNVSGKNNEMWWNKTEQHWQSTVNGIVPLNFAELQRFLCEEIQKPHYLQKNMAEKSVENFMIAPFCSYHMVNSALCDCDNVASMFSDANTRRLFLKTFGYRGAAQMGKTYVDEKIDDMRCKLSDKYKAKKEKRLFRNGAMALIVGVGVIKASIWLFRNIFGAKNQAASANPWVKETVSINVDDVNKISIPHLVRICEKNLVTIVYEIRGVRQGIRCLGLCGNTAIMPLHWYKTMMMHFPNGRFVVDFVRHDLKNKAGPSCKNVILDETCFSFDGGGHEQKKDFCFITHINLHLFHDIRKFFTNEKMNGVAPAYVVQRDLDGSTHTTQVSGITYVENFSYKCDYGHVTSEGYGGTSMEEIPLGSCGSPYVVDAPGGAYILGIHIASNQYKRNYAQRVQNCDLQFEPLCASAANIDLQAHYETKNDLTIHPVLHPKNPLKNVEGCLIVHGSIDARRPKQKTDVCDTLMRDDVLQHYGLVDNTHYPPIHVSTTKCLQDTFEKVGGSRCWPPSYVERATNALYNHQVKVILSSELPLPYKPYDRLTSINGKDGVAYVDRLPAKTSGGFQHTGRKDKYLVNIGSHPDHSECYDLNDDVMKEYRRLKRAYDNGERGQVVWDYNFKDEPITAQKIKDSRVRLFNCGPLHFNVLFGKYFGPFFPYFYGKDRVKLGHAVGSNAFGKDWKELYKKLIKNGFLRIGDADYAWFDKTTAAQMIHAALYSKYMIARDVFEWSDKHLKRMLGCITDLVYAIVNVFGTIVSLMGNNPSGQRFTTICNGDVSILQFLCSIMDICDEYGYEHPDYNNYEHTISLIVYGDDSCFSTNDARFNMKSISRAMAKYGMKMTMADKTAEMTEFVPIDKVTFLKRGFKTGYHEIFEVAAPLEEASIIKSLHVCTKSKVISFQQQCAEIILSANMEYFQYPKDKFLRENKFLNELLDKHNLRCYLKDGILPSYEDFITKFKDEDDLICSMEPIVTDAERIAHADLMCKFLGCEPGDYQLAASRLFAIQDKISKHHPHYVFRLKRVTKEFLYPFVRESFRLRLYGIWFLREDGLRPMKSVLRHFGDKYTIGGRYKAIFEMVSVFRYSEKGVYLSVQMAELYLEFKRHKLGCMAPSCRRTPATALKYLAMSIFYDYCMGCISLSNQAASFNCTAPSCLNDDVCVCIPPDSDCLDPQHSCEGEYTCDCPQSPMSEYITDDDDLIASMESSPGQPVPSNIGESHNEETTAVFADERDVSVMSYTTNYINNLFNRSKNPMAELANYLARPVLIRRQEWEVGVDFAPYQINPWQLWMANPNIARKFANYTLISGNLHVRIMVNGTPFHYGRILCGVYPLNQNMTFSQGPQTAEILLNMSPALGSWEPTRTFYTQRPHVLVNPTKNVTNIIEWPFFLDAQFHDIFDPASFHLGFLEVWVLNTLRQANGNTDPVEVTFWAHLENAVLTGINPIAEASMEPIPEDEELVASMANVRGSRDEYGKRLVSATATAVARTARTLATVPTIGPFARATEIGANAVAGIATIFGWSRPTNLETPCQVFRLNLGNLPNTSGSDNVVRLGLDPKGELTVDPNTVGAVNEDEMSFKYVAQREALIMQTPWTTTGEFDSSGRIMAWRVSPMTCPKTQPFSNRFLHQTPMTAVALPFTFWTGSIVYRIQVVCSAMHKGRLAVVYQPRPDNFMSPDDYNPADHFSYIIDIAKETDVSFEVKYQQYYAWANVADDDVDYTNKDGSDLTDANQTSNGFLAIYVINRLVAPVADSTVVINIYSRAGDDFRVATTSVDFSTYSYFGGAIFSLPAPAPSMEPLPLLLDEEEVKEDDDLVASMEHNDCGMAQLSTECEPVQTSFYVINDTAEPSGDEISQVYMGEHIDSIRALIKRYQPYAVFTKIGPAGTLGDTRFELFALPNFPIGRSNTPYGSSGNDGYSLVGNVPQTYLRHFIQGYAGWRGSIRYKWAYTMNQSRPIVSVHRANTANTSIQLQTTDVPNATTAVATQRLLQTRMRGNIGGGQIYVSQDSNSFAYELPFYTQWRVARGTATGTSIRSRPSGLVHSVRLFWPPATVASTGSNVAVTHVAAGEDFQFLFFIGFPPVTVLADVV